MLKTIEIGKDFKDTVALNDVSLTFPDKGLVIIKGESGSGKSTLLNLLTAHDYPTSGILEFNGKEINPKNSEKYRKSYCSNIYQDYMLIEDMTVGENIELAMQAYGEAYTTDSIKQMLQRVGIPEEYMTKQASKLSGGEKQRVSIARAVAKEHAMIFADEPTGNLDSVNGEMVMDLLKEISKDRLVVVVSHNEEYNIKYADYTVELVDGVVESCDLPTEDKEEQAPISFESKSKLKAKTLGKLAFWGFKKNKVKMAVSIVAFVMLCLLSLIFTVCTIGDVNLAYTYSLDNCKTKNFIAGVIRNERMTLGGVQSFEEKLSVGCAEVCSSSYSFDFGEVDLIEHQAFIRSYQALDEDEFSGIVPSIYWKLLYNSEIGMDVDVLYGDFPKEYNEVMLPYCYAQYVAKVFADFKTDDVKNLVGKEIKYGAYNYYRDEFYTFKICGIFEEGPYYTDLKKPQKRDVIEFYEDTNMLAKCAICSPEIKDIWYADAKLSGIAYVPEYVKIRDGFVINPDYIDNPFYDIESDYNCKYFGYNRFADYASIYPPLGYNEVYIQKDFADSRNIKVGDTLTDTGYKFVNENVERNFNGVVVKDIVDLPNIKREFIIFSSQYYMDAFIKEAELNNIKGFYFNMKGVKDVHGLLNKITSVGYDTNIWWSGEIGDNMDCAYTENLKLTTNFYNPLLGYRYFVFLPLTVISFIGLITLGFVSVSYLIAAKGNSYNILRSLGFGKKNIALILIVQIFTLIGIECIIGISLGALCCHLFGKMYIKSQLGAAVAKIATEIIFPMGYIAPIIVVTVSVLLGVAIALAKTRSLFAKSIVENKTN